MVQITLCCAILEPKDQDGQQSCYSIHSSGLINNSTYFFRQYAMTQSFNVIMLAGHRIRRGIMSLGAVASYCL